MTTLNYTLLTTNSTVLANIKNYYLSHPNQSYTFEAYVSRINQSPDLLNSLNNYAGIIQINGNPNANTHIYRLDNQNRDLLLNSTALLSPTYLTRALAHEIYGHDQTRHVILSVLDPSNPLYAGKSSGAIAELVKTGCFMAEALGFIGEYRIGKQAGFSPTGYPGLEADIANAIGRVVPLFPAGTNQRIIDLAVAQSLATKVQLNDGGHAQQCVNWANSVINATPNAAPTAQMISEYNPTTGESSATITTPTLKIIDKLLTDGAHSNEARSYDASGNLVSRTTTSINAASTQTTTAIDSNADNTIDKTTTRTDADRNGIAESIQTLARDSAGTCRREDYTVSPVGLPSTTSYTFRAGFDSELANKEVVSTAGDGLVSKVRSEFDAQSHITVANSVLAVNADLSGRTTTAQQINGTWVQDAWHYSAAGAATGHELATLRAN
jgi:hypothetical protein